MISHKSKNSTLNRKNVFQIICCFLILLIILLIYYICSYIAIYENEKQEKNYIHFIENKLFHEDVSDLNKMWKSDTLLKKTDIDNKQEASQANFDSKDEIWKGDSILFIPDINLEKIVYTGAERMEHLNQYKLITATDNMQYKNGGNYIICGHASRLYGHSLNRLGEIEEGNLIYIQTRDHIDEYIVKKVFYENMNKTSEYCNQTDERTLTIISCAKYISKESYIVIQAKLK